jgi:RNA polymerase sigma-70 factor (ECF subfamily)
MPNFNLVPDPKTMPMPSKRRPRPEGQIKTRLEIQPLISTYEAYIRRLALSILDDPGEADDAAQEVFIAAARSLAGFRGQSSPKTWLTAIAINVCRGSLRRRRSHLALLRRLGSEQRTGDAPLHPEQAVLQNEDHRRLWKAVDALDEKHRLPVILRYVHELTVPEIAASMGLREGTVHSRLHYARNRLLEVLGDLSPSGYPSPQAEAVDDDR